MSDETYLDGGFDLSPTDRDDGHDPIFRGVLWALPIGISFWLIVAAIVWLD